MISILSFVCVHCLSFIFVDGADIFAVNTKNELKKFGGPGTLLRQCKPRYLKEHGVVQLTG